MCVDVTTQGAILKRSKLLKREYAYVRLDIFICFIRTVHVYNYFIVFCLDIGYPYTKNNPIGSVVSMGLTNKLSNTRTLIDYMCTYSY